MFDATKYIGIGKIDVQAYMLVCYRSDIWTSDTYMDVTSDTFLTNKIHIWKARNPTQPKKIFGDKDSTIRDGVLIVEKSSRNKSHH